MTETVEVLKAARDLISDPKNWTQGHFAKTEKGSTINYESPLATCFCSVGALMRVTHQRLGEGYVSAFHALETTLDGNVYTFNDNHTHAEVLALFDKAIERASA